MSLNTVEIPIYSKWTS